MIFTIFIVSLDQKKIHGQFYQFWFRKKNNTHKEKQFVDMNPKNIYWIKAYMLTKISFKHIFMYMVCITSRQPQPLYKQSVCTNQDKLTQSLQN